MHFCLDLFRRMYSTLVQDVTTFILFSHKVFKHDASSSPAFTAVTRHQLLLGNNFQNQIKVFTSLDENFCAAYTRIILSELPTFLSPLANRPDINTVSIISRVFRNLSFYSTMGYLKIYEVFGAYRYFEVY